MIALWYSHNFYSSAPYFKVLVYGTVVPKKIFLFQWKNRRCKPFASHVSNSICKGKLVIFHYACLLVFKPISFLDFWKINLGESVEINICAWIWSSHCFFLVSFKIGNIIRVWLVMFFRFERSGSFETKLVVLL